MDKRTYARYRSVRVRGRMKDAGTQGYSRQNIENMGIKARQDERL